MAFEYSSCQGLVQAFHIDSARVQNGLIVRQFNLAGKREYFSPLCSKKTVLALAASNTPCVSVSMEMSHPGEALGTPLPWRVTCCVLGLPWGKKLQVCNCTCYFHVSIELIFMWASAFVNTVWWRSIYPAGSVWRALEVTHLTEKGILRPQFRFLTNLMGFFPL